MLGLLLLAAALSAATAAVGADGHVFSVASFGAVGDGRTNSTEAVRAAARAMAAAGGGVLLFPPGDFVTGSFNLSSNSELRVEGRLRGIPPAAPASAHWDYPLVDSLPSYNDGIVYSSLVHGRDLRNVSITGGGVVYGSGDVWWEWNGYSYNRTGGLLCGSAADCANTPRAVCQGNTCKAPTAAGLGGGRPNTVGMWGVEGLRISNVTVMRSPSWTIRLGYCTGVLIESLHVITNDTASGAPGQPAARFQPANTDGLDVDRYCATVEGQPALFLIDHISPIFARFFSVFSLLSPS